MRLSTVGFTICAGMANPMPEKPPVSETRKVLMPTTSPWTLTSGPPELPGLIAASVWMNWPGERRSAAKGLGRFNALTMPRVTVKRIPECEYGLTRMQLGGISQGHAGQVGSFNLDDGKIRERIRADELRRQDS